MSTERAIIWPREQFTYHDACRIAVDAKRLFAETIILDLGRVIESTTAAFARLVLLRRELLRCGRDLHLQGLQDRAAGLYEVTRLAGVLPLHDPRRPAA